MRVSLRFPSVNSLRECFNGSNCRKPNVKKLPLLDEKCILGSETAGEALYRRIGPEELAKKGCSMKFWAVTPLSTRSQTGKVVVSRKGVLLRELKGSGMVKWGTQRQVKYLARQMEDSGDDDHQKCVKKEEEGVGSEEEEEEVGSEEEEEKEEKDRDRSCEVGESSNGKRKIRAVSEHAKQKKKRPKLQEMNHQIVVCNQTNNKGKNNNNKNKLVKYIARWSLERYKLAEKNMLKIMKEVGAVHGNPILRPELRDKARRLIGDTGLLDHLLKHMAGKVAPGGEERFRRRHNSDGAMEYWLEKANLEDIRREAGVQDPYWTPPPGWVPGDSPTQDPLVAREIKELKEDIAKLKM